MKKYLVIFLAAFALTTIAFRASAADGPCASYAKLVRTIAESRQAGVPIEDVIDLARRNSREDVIPLILRAYKAPRYYAVKAYQQREIDDLVTTEYIKCLEAENAAKLAGRN